MNADNNPDEVQMEFGQAAGSPSDQTDNLFLQADQLLFKERRFAEARAIYEDILSREPNNIDAINSIAYCLKFASASSDAPLPANLFEQISSLYQKALVIDPNDIEANFNLGSLHL